MIHKLIDGPDLHLSERLIFKGLVQFGELTTSELVQLTGGSQSSVYRILCSLVDQGLVIHSALPKPGNGRRPITYRIDPASGFVFGAYLRWDLFGVGICSMDGTVLGKREWRLMSDLSPSEMVGILSEGLESLILDCGIPREKVLGLGFATTGPLLKEKGILFHPYHLHNPKWQVVPIRDMLEIGTGRKVVVSTLACAALVGELMGHKQGFSSRSSFVLLDLGVGTDTFFPGMMGKSLDDQSGTLGGMVIDHKAPRGTLSDYISIDSIYERFHKAFPQQIKAAGVSLLDEEGTGKMNLWTQEHKLDTVARMMGRLENDDMQVANGILEDISRALAAGLSNFINLLNPETVYFGGRVVVEFPQPVRDSIQRATAKRSAGFLSSIKFVESRVDDELLIKGSVYRFLDEHIGLLMPMSL